MKKIVILIVFIGLQLQVVNAQKVYTIDDVPNVHLRDRNAYVSDPEGKLSKKHIQKLNEQLRVLEDSLDVQCATIVLPAINTKANIFAHDLLNKWGVGNKQTNRGLVILLVYGGGEGNRKIYMGTSYGLEGDLPDALCTQIRIKTMVPLFKEDKFGEGLIAGVQETMRLLGGGQELTVPERIVQTEEVEDEYPILTTIAGMLLVFIGFLGYFRISDLKNAKDPYDAYMKDAQIEHSTMVKWIIFLLVPFGIPYLILIWLFRYIYIFSRIRCVKCGSSHIEKPTTKQITAATKKRKGVIQHSFLCRDCGHVKNMHTEFEHQSVYLSRMKKYSSSSGRSGSSSSGGSWGGGSSGGGGSGGSF